MSETPGWSTPGGPVTPPSPPPYGGGGAGGAAPGTLTTPRPIRDEGPGLVPMRPMGTGELLDTPFAALHRYPRVILTLSAIVTTITSLIVFFAELVGGSYAEVPDDTFQLTWGKGGNLAVGAVGTMVLAGLFAVVYGEAALGRPVTLGVVWSKVRRRLHLLLAVALLAGLVPYLALFALIIPGIFLWGALALAPPALMLEDQRIWAALRRSWRLSVGDWWRIWGMRLLAGFVAFVVGGVLALPFGAVAFRAGFEARGLSELELFLATVGNIVGGTVSASLSAGVLALLYIDRRMRYEGLDISLAAAAREQRGQR